MRTGKDAPQHTQMSEDNLLSFLFYHLGSGDQHAWRALLPTEPSY